MMGSRKNFTVLFGMAIKDVKEIVERIKTAKASLRFTVTGNCQTSSNT